MTRMAGGVVRRGKPACAGSKNFAILGYGLLLLTALVFSSEVRAVESVKVDLTAKLLNSKVPLGNSFSIVKEGLSIEFTAIPSSNKKYATDQKLIEGQEAKIRFEIKDQATGAPIRGLFPAAWMDRQKKVSEGLSCKEKIGSFLQGRLAYRPTNDLNAWYLLAMNEKASISVIDPLVESTASQMLLDLILLESPGEAWALDSKAEVLYVTLPDTGKVAVVDMITWDVSTYLSVGSRPVEINFQPDQKYLWVGIDGGIDGPDKAGGVGVIDPETNKIVAKIATGHGHHEIAFSDDSRFAYLTNEMDGTVSVIDIWKLKKMKDIKAGKQPASLAYSSTAQSVYVVDSEKGTLHVIDGKSQEVSKSIDTTAGSSRVLFAPDGRWAFVTNPTLNKVLILDASVNSIAHSFEIGIGPHHVVFNDNYAFVHSMGSAKVSIIDLNSLNTRGAVPVVEIRIGSIDPNNSSKTSRADSIAITPEKSSVVIANPNDKNISYYMEGMNAPMGSFGNFMRRPKAVLTVDRGLRETSPGVYEAHVKLSHSGTYDIAFLLDSPQLTHCFTATVAVDPVFESKRNKAIKLEVMTNVKFVDIGQPTEIRVKLTDGTGTPKSGVKDLRVLTFLYPGVWQKRLLAQPLENGEYVVKLSFPKPGIYYVLFESSSLSAPMTKWPKMVLRTKKEQDKHAFSNNSTHLPKIK